MRTQPAAPARPVLVLAVSTLAAFLAFLDVTVVNIAFPAVAATFPTTSLADLSWIFNAYNVVFAALLVPAGRLADRFGRKRIFLFGMVLFGLASAACALAPTAGALVGARIAQAVAAALITPTSLALLLPVFPPERQGVAVGAWGAVGAVAVAAGPSVGGLLVEVAGWRAVFLVNLPVVLFTVLAGTRVLAESRDPAARLPDAVSVALLAGGVALLSLGIVGSEDWTWTDPRTLGALAGGVALLAAFAVRSTRVPVPVVEPALFRVRAFAAAVAGYLVFSVAFYPLLLANVLFLTTVWGYDAFGAGLAVTPGPLMAALASPVAGRLADRVGPRVVIAAGGLLFAAGCTVFALRLGAQPAYLTAFLPATLLTGAGVGSTYAGLSTAAVVGLPPARFATGSAVGTCARQIGAVLGIALLLSGLAAAGPAAFDIGYTLMAVGGLAAAACGLAVGVVRVPSPVPVPVPSPVPVPVPAEESP